MLENKFFKKAVHKVDISKLNNYLKKKKKKLKDNLQDK